MDCYDRTVGIRDGVGHHRHCCRGVWSYGREGSPLLPGLPDAEGVGGGGGRQCSVAAILCRFVPCYR